MKFGKRVGLSTENDRLDCIGLRLIFDFMFTSIKQKICHIGIVL